MGEIGRFFGHVRLLWPGRPQMLHLEDMFGGMTEKRGRGRAKTFKKDLN